MATKKNNLVSNTNTPALSNNWSTKKDPVPKKVSPVPKKTTVSHFSYKKHATIFDLGTKKYVKIWYSGHTSRNTKLPLVLDPLRRKRNNPGSISLLI